MFSDNRKITSTHNLTVIFIFNICDTLARWSASYINLGKCGTCILGLSRVGFLFTTIAFAKGDFKSDILNLINLVLFSLTNGFVATRCCILAPQ